MKNPLKNINPTTKAVGIGSFIVLLLFLISYKKGKGDGKQQVIDKRKDAYVPLPTEGGQLTEVEAQTVRKITLKIFNSLDGLGFIFRDSAPYKLLAEQTDKIFVAVYNDFNSLYAEKDKGTLRDWIDDDYYDDWSDVTSWVKNILARMDSLNLK